MSELPSFNFNLTIHESDAWHDKIEWAFTPFALLPTGQTEEEVQESIDGFLYHLSGPDSFTEEQEASPNFGWLFRPERDGNTRYIRKGRFRWGNVHLPRPVFSGHVEVKKSDEDCPVQFSLHVNPTRQLHHRSEISSDPLTPWPHAAALCASEQRSEFDGEFSLDGQDNWIPQSGDYGSIVWRRPFRSAPKCLRQIHEAILAEACRSSATSCTDIALLQDQKHSIRYLETYWEFAADDPVRLVSSLSGILQRFARTGSRARIYRKRGHGGDEWNKNCMSITIGLARGEMLTVYAKTNSRIRFEIRQTFKGNRKLLGRSHTARDMAGVDEILKAARARCTDQMRDLFQFIRGQAVMPPDSASTTEFLCELATSLRRSPNFSTVLSLLLSHGQINSVPGLRKEINALKRAKIIVLNGSCRTGCYIVAPRYTEAWKKLKRKGLAFEFVTRDR